MCYGCWEEAGSPKIVNDRTLSAVPLIKRVYEFSCVGGNLHCELDDWNVEDQFFEEFKPYDPSVPADQLAAEKACFNSFKSMSEAERYSALALESEFFDSANT